MITLARMKRFIRVSGCFAWSALASPKHRRVRDEQRHRSSGPARDDLLAIVRAVLPRGPGQASVSAAPYGTVLLANSDIAEAGIRAGDVLLMMIQGKALLKRERRAINGSVRQVPREAFCAVLENAGTLTAVESSWPPCPLESAMESVLTKLKSAYNRFLRAKNGIKSPSPLLILRPWRVVSSTILADTDTAALLELISQAGGRLTTREEA
jgi:hypothetical protein